MCKPLTLKSSLMYLDPESVVPLCISFLITHCHGWIEIIWAPIVISFVRSQGGDSSTYLRKDITEEDIGRFQIFLPF